MSVMSRTMGSLGAGPFISSGKSSTNSLSFSSKSNASERFTAKNVFGNLTLRRNVSD